MQSQPIIHGYEKFHSFYEFCYCQTHTHTHISITFIIQLYDRFRIAISSNVSIISSDSFLNKWPRNLNSFLDKRYISFPLLTFFISLHNVVFATQIILESTSLGIIQMTAPDPTTIYSIHRGASMCGYANLIFCYGHHSFFSGRDKTCTRVGT